MSQCRVIRTSRFQRKAAVRSGKACVVAIIHRSRPVEDIRRQFRVARAAHVAPWKLAPWKLADSAQLPELTHAQDPPIRDPRITQAKRLCSGSGHCQTAEMHDISLAVDFLQPIRLEALRTQSHRIRLALPCIAAALFLDAYPD